MDDSDILSDYLTVGYLLLSVIKLDRTSKEWDYPNPWFLESSHYSFFFADYIEPPISSFR